GFAGYTPRGKGPRWPDERGRREDGRTRDVGTWELLDDIESQVEFWASLRGRARAAVPAVPVAQVCCNFPVLVLPPAALGPALPVLGRFGEDERRDARQHEASDDGRDGAVVDTAEGRAKRHAESAREAAGDGRGHAGDVPHRLE